MSGLAMMMSGVFRLLVIRCEYVGKRNIKMPFDLVHHDALQGFGNLVVILARPIFKARPNFIKKENAHHETDGKTIAAYQDKRVHIMPY